MQDVAADMKRRFAPSPAQVEAAKAVLALTPGADLAFVPIALPGKRHGLWEYGQEVRPIEGVVLAAVNAFESHDERIMSGSQARYLAEQVARAALGDREGTVAYASIFESGSWAVFEGM